MTARRSNQSILKEINPEYSLKGLLLKLQYFDHLMQRADLLEKTLMLGKIECKRRRGWQRMRWLDRITDSMDMNLGKLQESGILQCMGLQRVSWGCDLVAEQQQSQTLKSYKDNMNKTIYKPFNSVNKKCKSLK